MSRDLIRFCLSFDHHCLSNLLDIFFGEKKIKKCGLNHLWLRVYKTTPLALSARKVDGARDSSWDRRVMEPEIVHGTTPLALSASGGSVMVHF
jgi:hypothetical protein